MTRIVHDFEQGSPAWHAHRITHLNASEAAAMLGLSPYMTRTDLVRYAATGLRPEIEPGQQKRFDDGHAFEALARPWAEEIVGEELYPACMSLDHESLALAASFDGVTMGEDVTFEHKSLNADLDAALARGEIPESYRPQLEHGLMVCGASRCLFMASNGTRESMRFAWYEADPLLRAKIIAGWRQFQADVANYQHVEAVPRAMAEPQLSLPTPVIEVTGSVALHSNLASLGEQLRAYIETIPAKPSTDQEFANCEAAAKALKVAEERLTAAEDGALARFTSIDEMRSTIAALKDLARTQRLHVERVVKARKDEIRVEILQDGQRALAAHIARLNDRLGRPYMPTIPADFAGAMRGKKTVATLRDAVSVELSRAKIAASEIADRIEVNLKLLAQHPDYTLLFADAGQIVLKANDDFAVLVKSRVAEYQREQQAKLDSERERIRREEEAKAQAKVEAEVRSAKPAAPVFPEPAKPVSATTIPSASRRPTDEQIIAAVTAHFHVDRAQAVSWLLEMDLEAVRLAA
jgi:putative phage-type endonuclease